MYNYMTDLFNNLIHVNCIFEKLFNTRTKIKLSEK
jgi:hypothetical protein